MCSRFWGKVAIKWVFNFYTVLPLEWFCQRLGRWGECRVFEPLCLCIILTEKEIRKGLR